MTSIEFHFKRWEMKDKEIALQCHLFETSALRIRISPKNYASLGSVSVRLYSVLPTSKKLHPLLIPISLTKNFHPYHVALNCKLFSLSLLVNFPDSGAS